MATEKIRLHQAQALGLLVLTVADVFLARLVLFQLVEGIMPQPSPTLVRDYFNVNDGIPIQQITLPIPLSLPQRLEELKKLHNQGMTLILNR